MSTTKTDLKREFRGLYSARREPALVEVPELAYLMIDGAGDPNGATFREAVQALYCVAYGARFALKRAGTIDYAVMPLEGLWWAANPDAFVTGDRSSWQWTLMIMQPEQVTPEVFAAARTAAARDRALHAISSLRLEHFEEGAAAQVLHVGPFATERAAIKRLHAFIDDLELDLTGRHHEIYLRNPERTAPERLQTILRQPVASRMP